jgi:hypothetical protein
MRSPKQRLRLASQSGASGDQVLGQRPSQPKAPMQRTEIINPNVASPYINLGFHTRDKRRKRTPQNAH